MPSFIQPLRARVPVVLVSTTLLKFASAWRAAALSIPDVGIAVFFIAGMATTGAGVLAPWFVAAAVLLGLACRTLDVEGWGVRVPGGLVGRAGLAFGPRAAAVAAAAQLLERLLFAGLVSLVFGHYLAALPMQIVRADRALARLPARGGSREPGGHRTARVRVDTCAAGIRHRRQSRRHAHVGCGRGDPRGGGVGRARGRGPSGLARGLLSARLH